MIFLYLRIRTAYQDPDYVQTIPETREVTQPVDVPSSALTHSSSKQPSKNYMISGYPRKPRRCHSWPGRGSNIPSAATTEVNGDLGSNVIEGGNDTSSPAPEQPVCPTIAEEVWPGSSSGADTSTDGLDEENIGVEAVPEPVLSCEDDTQIPRDQPSSMHTFHAKRDNDGGSDGSSSESKDIDDGLSHNIDRVPSEPNRKENERTGTAWQSTTPTKPSSAPVSTASKQHDSRH